MHQNAEKEPPRRGAGAGRKVQGASDGRRPGGARHRRRRTQFAGAARRAAACGRRGRAPVSRRHGKAPGRGGREMRCPLSHGLAQGAGTAAGPAVPSTADGERSSPEPPGGRRPAAVWGGLPTPQAWKSPRPCGRGWYVPLFLLRLALGVVHQIGEGQKAIAQMDVDRGQLLVFQPEIIAGEVPE